MEVQVKSDPKVFDCLAADAGRPESGEDAVRQALASWEERERRRIEFRSSLLNARAALARDTSLEMVQQAVQPFVQESMRQLSAELRERRPGRMMAGLANAH